MDDKQLGNSPKFPEERILLPVYVAPVSSSLAEWRAIASLQLWNLITK